MTLPFRSRPPWPRKAHGVIGFQPRWADWLSGAEASYQSVELSGLRGYLMEKSCSSTPIVCALLTLVWTCSWLFSIAATASRAMDCSRSIVVPISAVEAWVRFVSKGEGGVWRYADRFVPNKLVAFHRWRHNRIGPVKVTIFTAIFNDPEPALAGFQAVPKGINYGRWHVRVADHVMTDG